MAGEYKPQQLLLLEVALREWTPGVDRLNGRLQRGLGVPCVKHMH